VNGYESEPLMTDESSLSENFHTRAVRLRLGLGIALAVLAICGGGVGIYRQNICLGPWFIGLGILALVTMWMNAFRIVVSYEMLPEALRYWLLFRTEPATLPLSQIAAIVPLRRYRREKYGFAIRTRAQKTLLVEYDLGITTAELERRLVACVAMEQPNGNHETGAVTGQLSEGSSPTNAVHGGLAVVLSVPIIGFCAMLVFVGLRSLAAPRDLGDLSLCLWAGVAIFSAWCLFLYYQLVLTPRRTVLFFRLADGRFTCTTRRDGTQTYPLSSLKSIATLRGKHVMYGWLIRFAESRPLQINCDMPNGENLAAILSRKQHADEEQ
jgi:hypothetical protein